MQRRFKCRFKCRFSSCRRHRACGGRSRGRRGAGDGGVLVEDGRSAGRRSGFREPPCLFVQCTDCAGGHVQFPAGELGLRTLDEGEGHLPGVTALSQRVPLQARRLDPAGGQTIHNEFAQNRRVLLPADAAGLGLTNRPCPLRKNWAFESAHVLDIHAGDGGDLFCAGACPHVGLQFAGADGRTGARRYDRLRQCGWARTAHGRAQGVIDNDAVAFTRAVGHHDGVTVGAQQLELDHREYASSCPSYRLSVPSPPRGLREVDRCGTPACGSVRPEPYRIAVRPGSRSRCVVLWCACPARRGRPPLVFGVMAGPGGATNRPRARSSAVDERE